MPVRVERSPFERAAVEGLTGPTENEPEGSSGSGKRKGGSRPTTSRRNKRQKTKERYAKAREDAQLEGIIPTTPEGAAKPEQVPASAQGSQPMPELIAQAIRRGWAVPNGRKPELVDEMVAIVLDVDMPAKQKVAAFNALRMADRSQWEQDNPVEAGKVKGGATTTVGVSIQANMLAVQVLREALQNDEGRGETALPPPTEPSALGHSRFDGEVEVGAASTSDERDAS